MGPEWVLLWGQVVEEVGFGQQAPGKSRGEDSRHRPSIEHLFDTGKASGLPRHQDQTGHRVGDHDDQQRVLTPQSDRWSPRLDRPVVG